MALCQSSSPFNQKCTDSTPSLSPVPTDSSFSRVITAPLDRTPILIDTVIPPPEVPRGDDSFHDPVGSNSTPAVLPSPGRRRGGGKKWFQFGKKAKKVNDSVFPG